MTPPLPELPPRPRDGHKGTFGHVLCLAGSLDYPGAAVLCTRAALRGGAGLVTLGYPAFLRPVIGPQLLCEMGYGLPDEHGVLGPVAVDRAVALAHERDAVALGPGLSRAAHAAQFARDVALRCERPLVLDADGLNAFEGHTGDLRRAAGPRILTPHPGEAARLLGCTTAEVAADREAAARQLAADTEAVVLLKGADTVVCDATVVCVNTTGNVGLATGGSGDVLTGLVAALLAQGLPPFEAARLGAHLHGRAAEFAAAEHGVHGMIASDLLRHLPHALREHARTEADT
jgi:NAD(P)H-hydrate epimerase